MADDITLLGIASQIEAQIWRDALAQEGIRVLMRSADPLGPAGYTSSFGDVAVYVRREHERRARWIIGDAIEPPLIIPGDEARGEDPLARAAGD